MYLEYFGLTEKPFSIAPDPQYLYMSARHKEAMAHLTYGLSQGGCFIVLTGEVGTGKTTLCRNLLEELPESMDVALILNANINETELLQTVCDELKIEYSEGASQKQLLDEIYVHLLSRFADNRQTVLIIDEAQLLRRDVLEQIRLLTNLETTKSKLLQIILIGQPELNDLLSRDDLRQLAQRVTARYHLGALPLEEIKDYVYFRLSVAGCRKPLFSKQALKQLHKSTDGIPRRINVLADHALLSTYSQNQVLVDAKTVKSASTEVFVQSTASNKREQQTKRWWFLAAACVLLVNAALWWWFLGREAVGTQGEIAQANQLEASSNDRNDTADQAQVTAVTPSIGGGASAGSSIQISDADGLEPISLDGEGLTKIITSDEIKPGSVVISDEPLDDEPVLVNPVPRPSTPKFNADSDFGKILDASADVTGRIAAFRSLSEAWDVSLPSKMLRSPCDELRDEGVQCLIVASWQRMLRFNRPAILALKQRGQLHRVILFKVEDGRAHVLVGESVAQLSIEELRARTAKNAVVFWRPSEVVGDLLQEGDVSGQLPNVRKRLNAALAAVSMPLVLDVSSPTFDADLTQKVFALQSRFSILPDGKIGNETYLLMNELLLPDATPVLTPRVKTQQ